MIRLIITRFLLPVILVPQVSLFAQTQDDFNKSLSDVYANAADKKKAIAIAKDMFAMVEKKKDLQTYANYYLLKTIFEVQAPDTAFARKATERGNQVLNGMGASTTYADTTSNPFNKWYYSIYPGLFSNQDPQIANKAINFINRYPEFKTFDAFYYIAYSFERTGDFPNAKKYYEQALQLDTIKGDTYRTYLFYTNFLSKSGDYVKAEEMIRKMEKLSVTGSEMFRDSYKSEAMSARVVYYLNIGDYNSYVLASEKNNDYASVQWRKGNNNPCDPFPGIRYTTSAFGKEMMKEYDAAERLWKSRDSANYVWVTCHNKTYPNNQYFPISMYPVYMIKRGKSNRLPQPASYYMKETETHYNSYSQYADLSIRFMKAVQLGFLGSNRIDEMFTPLTAEIRNNRNFKESTLPISNYAYFSMRNRNWEKAQSNYEELFSLNVDWINDIIFTFGEKAFATYYNAKLKEGYENFHSFVRLAKEKQPGLYPTLAAQAYNNLLFTKSISLKGTEKRKQAFLNAKDPTITALYNLWIEKKQALIRQYLKIDQPSNSIDTVNRITPVQLREMQDEVNKLEDELTRKASDFKKYLKLVPTDWKTVRDQLKDDEAAIEMIRFEWRDQVYYSDTIFYAAYIIRKNSEYPEVVYLPDEARELETRYFRTYKNSIRLKVEDKDSYNHFWKPVAEKLDGIRKVYFSADGIYHLINLSALKNQATGRYLLDELDINYTTSGVDVKKESKALDMRTAVFFARPAYKVAALSETAKATTRSLVSNFKDSNPADLVGTEEEVKAIIKDIDPAKTKVSLYIREQATEDRMYQLHSPDVVHIATHGYWSPAGENATDGYRTFNAMVNSGLLLTGVVNFYSMANYPDTYDGILTAYEAQNMDLDKTSLVILSACETGLGYLDAGEGVYGLQRAFRAAGASTVMTSLWKVDDAATRDFMIEFYRSLLKSGDKKSSFLAAEKAIRDKYKDPYYWAAFIMTGQ